MMRLFRFLLFPFAILYDAVTSVRNLLFEVGFFKSTSFQIPVISVGNLSVGGTGKTPQIEYLIRLLSIGKRLAILSRGYKRNTTGFLSVNTTHTAKDVGDEPLQYFKKFKNLQVAVDENRVHGIEQLLASKYPPEIILLDDAFQHRKVTAGFSIVLTKYDDLFVDDFLLPTGNLRESRRGAKRADTLIVTKCPEEISNEEREQLTKKIRKYFQKSIFFSTIGYASVLKSNQNQEILLSELLLYDILLVTGIANSSPLVSYLESKKCRVQHLNFPDHYQFKDKDLQKIKNQFTAISSEKKMILTTEKDFVRLSEKIDLLYFIAIETKLLSSKEEFDSQIKSYVKMKI